MLTERKIIPPPCVNARDARRSDKQKEDRERPEGPDKYQDDQTDIRGIKRISEN